MDLMAEPRRPDDGNGFATFVSIAVHVALLILFVRLFKPVAQPKENVPMARYVELMRQQPEFTEAPGAHVDKAPLNAPMSDASRRASMPEPTGDTPTSRPGSGEGLYTPEMRSGQPAPRQQQQQPQQPRQAAQAQPAPAFSQGGQARAAAAAQQETVAASAAAPIDWRSAIKQVKGSASSGSDSYDLAGAGGGTQGSADAGPLSFETQWYDWGAYAQSMVSKLRVNWYANMPQIIRTGLKGVVTIRFTIHRDGSITDIETLESSTVPPYDFAARKAIELSSPLNPLPKDFPNASERVTCMFYYNMDVPARR
jgi:TonB family protein